MTKPRQQITKMRTKGIDSIRSQGCSLQQQYPIPGQQKEGYFCRAREQSKLLLSSIWKDKTNSYQASKGGKLFQLEGTEIANVQRFLKYARETVNGYLQMMVGPKMLGTDYKGLEQVHPYVIWFLHCANEQNQNPHFQQDSQLSFMNI